MTLLKKNLLALTFIGTPFIFKVFSIDNIYLVPLYLFYSTVILFILKKYVTTVRGNLLFLKGDTLKAIPFFEKALKSKTKNSTMYLNYSICLLIHYEYKKAFDVLEIADNLPSKPLTKKNILITKATCYWLNEEIDLAIETLNNVISIYDYANPNTLTTLGYFYIVKKDFDNAILYTNKALDVDGNYYVAYDNLGQICFLKNDFDNAIKYFLKVVDKYKYVDSYYFLAKIYKEQHNTELYNKYKDLALNSSINGMNTITTSDLELL